MRSKFYIFTLIICFAFSTNSVSAQKSKAVSQTAVRSITVVTEPNAIIWLSGVNYGTTDENGKLTLSPIPAGAQTLRVRADGFKEISQNLTAAQKGEIKVALTKTTDEAELTFQQAEKTAATDKKKAEELYRKALELNPKHAEAHLGLARVFADEGLFEEAHEEITKAKKIRPVYPEASAVKGRIYKTQEEEEKAIEAFKTAIREGKGFQPEANTGLALLYREKAEIAGNSGDFEGEEANYEEAIKYFEPAVKQLAGAPDAVIIYQFYGLVYEKLKKYDEAIKVYEDFLKTFPNSSEAGAVQSFIVQLKKQMSESQP